jgi:hypothetical protein
MENYIEIENLTNEELVIMCNEIFDYQNGNGNLNKDTSFYKVFKENQSKYTWDIRFFERLVIDEATKRFDKVVRLLMINRSYFFIRK